MGLSRFAINKAVKLKNILSYDSYLFVGPHPDDIEIGAGATIAKLVSLGKKVTFLICTDGRYGKENLKEDISCDKLAEIRKEECYQSAKILGVESIIFLDLSDGNQYTYEELTLGIAKTINNVAPDIIFTCDPDTTNECHKDHLNVGRACKELANFANYKDIFKHYLDGEQVNDINIQAIAFYMTYKPNQYVKVNKFVKKQVESIMAHDSQYPNNSDALNSLLLYLKLRRIDFGFKSFKFSAEGFRVLDRTRMHCLAEAGR